MIWKTLTTPITHEHVDISITVCVFGLACLLLIGTMFFAYTSEYRLMILYIVLTLLNYHSTILGVQRYRRRIELARFIKKQDELIAQRTKMLKQIYAGAPGPVTVSQTQAQAKQNYGRGLRNITWRGTRKRKL